MFCSTVYFALNQITYNNLKGAALPNRRTFKETDTIVLSNISVAGWTFDGWFDAEVGGDKVEGWAAGTKTDNVVVYAHWTAIEVHYTVKSHFQKVSGDGYEQKLSEYPDDNSRTGYTDTTTDVVASAITGFTAQSIVQMRIAGDQSTIVDIYYDRNMITYSFDGNGGKWGENETSQTVSGLY